MLTQFLYSRELDLVLARTFTVVCGRVATTKVLVVSSRKENHRQLDTENHREIVQDATVSLPTS